jgi:hypothetical protein
MPMPKPLSKSKLIAYRQCPKRLWLEIFRPDLRADNAATQAVFATGHKVGALAQSIFDATGTGYLVDMHTLGIDGAIAKTQSLVSAPSPQPIFEAGFKADAVGNGGALSFADVLLPDAQSGENGQSESSRAWHMIEVKSSTKVKDYYREDAAIQYHVAKNAGVNLTAISIAVVDTSWVYRGDGDYKGLLKLEDVTDSSAAQDADVRAWITDAQVIAQLGAAPAQKTGDHCDSPFPCGFYAHCSKEDGTADLQVEHPADWLPRISKGKIVDAFGTDADKRFVSMFDIPDSQLNVLQRRVKAAHRTGKPFIDAVNIQNQLAPHQPHADGAVYFLDFETIAQAVPIWANTRPYQAVLYQFSCHVMSGNGTLKHHEFLDTSGNDPRIPFADALVTALGESSSAIFVYSSFERTQLKALAIDVPKHSAAIGRIIERLVDLLPIVQGNYYHPLMQGSWSIKSVLPAMFGNGDADLSYEKLAASVEGGAVADGGAATVAFIEAIEPTTTRERRAAIHAQLLAYCKLDTLAMVRVWEQLSSNAAAKM